jgi:cyclopropane fatty-acyl-phospholipid synthase-like methyltransferase
VSTDNIAGFHDAREDWHRRQQWGVHFLVDMFHLKSSDRVLDLGCGPLCLGSWLIGYLDEGNYAGLDKDGTLLGAGQALVTAKGLEGKRPRLIQANNLAATTLGTEFDVIWSHSVLIHMDPATVDTALDFMARHLAPNGVAWFTMNLGPHKILGEWTFGPNYQHPMPEHKDLHISSYGLLTDLRDVVWCPPDSGMQATMLRATRRNGACTTPTMN